MGDEAIKYKCEVPGCENEADWCYHGSGGHKLCQSHDRALDSYYHCLAARDESHEADDKGEAILAAIGAGKAAIGDYVAARKEARAKDALVDRYIRSWIRDQGATEG